MIRRLNGRPAQRGMALITVLLLLMVFSVIGTSAFLLAGTDLKISVNVQQNLEAVYAAEAGVHALLAFYRSNPEAFLQRKNGTALPLPDREPGRSNWRQFQVWLEALRYDTATSIPRFAEVTVQALDPLSQSRSRVKATLLAGMAGAGELPGPFPIGLATAGRVMADRTADLQTDCHANGGYALDPELKTRLQQQGNILTQSADSAAADYRPPVEVPALTAEELAYFRSLARTGANQYFTGNVTLPLQGDQGGRLMFVEGNARIEGNALSGVTVVSTGSIVFSGSAGLNGQGRIDNAFFSGGDMRVITSGGAAGIFWCQGWWQAGGSGWVQGLVVSRGGIRGEGPLLFRRNLEVEHAYLPSSSDGHRIVLKGWLQL